MLNKCKEILMPLIYTPKLQQVHFSGRLFKIRIPAIDYHNV